MGLNMNALLLLTISLSCCLLGIKCKNDLQIVKEWIQVEVAFPDDATEQAAIASGEYVQKRILPLDIGVHYSSGSESPRTFVTFPRFTSGVPVTLGELKSDGLVHGYPDYETNANQGNNCDGLISVERVAIDECNQLWVMDTGKIGNNQLCPPQLLAYNLDNDQLVFRHEIPRSLYFDTSLFGIPVVDTRSATCDNTFVYVADVRGYGIVVVDVENNRSWRAQHRLFYPYPDKGTFTIGGVSYDVMDGLGGFALLPLDTTTNDRLLYFHAISSVTENVVKTSLLRNDSLIKNSNLNINDVTINSNLKRLKNERKTQTSAEALDSNGIIYFGLLEPPSILCYNTATEFGQENFHSIATNSETLQFASGIKVVNNDSGEQELYVLTNSAQKYMTNTLSDTKPNFRIHTGKISDLLSDSPCLSN